MGFLLQNEKLECPSPLLPENACQKQSYGERNSTIISLPNGLIFKDNETLELKHTIL